MDNLSVNVIGGGLAGSEAAWQLAERGINVTLYEMRPHKRTPAHTTDKFAELVCSNSLGSKLPDRATGLLQQELKHLGSLLISCAESCAVPSGGSLAVDREAFSGMVTRLITSHPQIQIIHQEATEIPDGPTIIATGPLTSETLSKHISAFTGKDYLYFYDATSPIVMVETIDFDIAFRAGRYDRNTDEKGDYINCPMNRDEYYAFIDALLSTEKITLRDFESEDPHFFEGCLPIEELARRGNDTLAFGPMRPVGLRDPRTGKRPYAVVQLRQDNLIGSLYNMVGFQTNIRWGDQEKVLRSIPGLAEAEFVRLGQMHRNTYLNAPALLYPTMQYRKRSDLFFGGQITGVEGYAGNIATGLVAAINMERHLCNQDGWALPPTTMIGALCHYVSNAGTENFQPMKANFGIFPDLESPAKNKQLRYSQYVARATEDLRSSINAHNLGIVKVQ
jgi:methylenetetrahydrofolate--tRNA-(uracil-5-)-methyltransferase